MTWKLHLDDDCLREGMEAFRYAPPGYHKAISVKEAQELVEELGLPEEMQLDHDLGEGQPHAMEFIKWLSIQFPDGPVPVTRVHSMNPVGKKNLESFVESWRKSLEG